MKDGLFDLKTVSDLFHKLEFDLQRLKQHPTSQYTAFDFFVTAEHMLDWQLPGSARKEERKTERDGHKILAVCSHIANGAKHFTVEMPHHVSVAKTSAAYAGFQSNAFQRGTFQAEGSLIVVLDGDAAKELGEKMEVVSLAERVTDFWKKRLEKDNP